ncbi:MAG: hypothetical protein WBC04_14005 [Candidatus Acidiferrales bacterium]
MAAPVFFDDIVTPFYEKVGLDYRRQVQIGQLCYTHVLYAYENRELWRPDHYDGTQTQAQVFRIVAAQADAYARNLPLASPKLETDEEFPVVRAKKRPVVVIRPVPAQVPIRPLAGGPRIDWPLEIIVPTYSVVRKDDSAKFPPELIERVRRLEYPEFFFLPDRPGALSRDSFLRLARMTNCSPSHLEPTQWKLADEALQVLLGQVRFYFQGPYEGKYATAREMPLRP